MRMKAAVIEALGAAPRYADFAEPDVQAGEEIVAVEVASVKQLDRAIAAGTHYSSPKVLPVACGTDGVGRLADGTRAFFAVNRRPFGAMAERAPASWTVPLPEGLDPAVAAAIVNPSLAAWLPLVWRGKLRPGENVLILGATGAAGKMAIAAARLLGAGRVIAAGRRQEVLAGLGADATIDLRLERAALRDAFSAEAAGGLGVVIDYVWGPSAEALFDVLVKSDLSAADPDGDGVRFVSVGAMAGADIRLPSAVLRGARLSIMGSGTGNFPPIPRMREVVADILGHAARGEIALKVEEVPLARVAEAWSGTGDPDQRIVFRVEASGTAQ